MLERPTESGQKVFFILKFDIRKVNGAFVQRTLKFESSAARIALRMIQIWKKDFFCQWQCSSAKHASITGVLWFFFCCTRKCRVGRNFFFCLRNFWSMLAQNLFHEHNTSYDWWWLISPDEIYAFGPFLLTFTDESISCRADNCIDLCVECSD